MRWVVALLVVVFLCGCAAPASNLPVSQLVLIDPGHGGFDGGAVAADGTKEKDINLAISLCLSDMLRISGVPTEMTRNTDAAVAYNKTEDMQQRLRIYESAATVIAVHQNHFHQAKYNGAQVFYSANHPYSERLAETMQCSIASRLQPQNDRQIKSATDGIYLMHHTTVPAILVECGFLSNEEELTLLKQTDYRQRLAWSICLGYWEYRVES